MFSRCCCRAQTHPGGPALHSGSHCTQPTQAIDRARGQAPTAKAGSAPAPGVEAADAIKRDEILAPIVAASAPQADLGAEAAARTRIERQIEDDLLLLMLADVV